VTLDDDDMSLDMFKKLVNEQNQEGECLHHHHHHDKCCHKNKEEEPTEFLNLMSNLQCVLNEDQHEQCCSQQSTCSESHSDHKDDLQYFTKEVESKFFIERPVVDFNTIV